MKLNVCTKVIFYPVVYIFSVVYLTMLSVAQIVRVNNELKKVRKEVVVAEFEIMSQNLPERNERTEKYQEFAG
jgi:hypothetical protein